MELFRVYRALPHRRDQPGPQWPAGAPGVRHGHADGQGEQLRQGDDL